MIVYMGLDETFEPAELTITEEKAIEIAKKLANYHNSPYDNDEQALAGFISIYQGKHVDN